MEEWMGGGGEKESKTYIFGFGLTLEIRFDGFVLFVELGEVRDEVFDDIGVREGVDAGFMGDVWWDAAYCSMSQDSQTSNAASFPYTNRPTY